MTDIEQAREHAQLESNLRSERHRADRWRGIASAMGYEPNAHKSVKPESPWVLGRVAQFRAQVIDAAIRAERERCAAIVRGFVIDAHYADVAAIARRDEKIRDAIRKEPT